MILDGEGRLLVVRRANPPAAGRWSVPGGRVEHGETDRAAVLREVREETGLDVEVVRRLGSVEIAADDAGGTVFDVEDYLCTCAPGAVPTAGDDAEAVAWADAATFAGLDLVDGLHDTLADWHVLPR